MHSAIDHDSVSASRRHPSGQPHVQIASTPRRKVASSVFTAGIWIRGQFVLPKLHSLLNHLNISEAGFVKLVHVRLPGVEKPLEFLALRADRIAFLVPDPAGHLIGEPAHNTARHEVSCLFPSGHINGWIETVAGIRVSDFLGTQSHFFAIRDCSIRLAGHAPVHAPLALVNSRELLGLSQPQIA